MVAAARYIQADKSIPQAVRVWQWAATHDINLLRDCLFCSFLNQIRHLHVAADLKMNIFNKLLL